VSSWSGKIRQSPAALGAGSGDWLHSGGGFVLFFGRRTAPPAPVPGKFGASCGRQLKADPPIEGLYQVPLLLRVTADSQPGSAASPLINTKGGGEGFFLTFNGAEVAGILCFAASGTDYIWSGLHYWEFAVAGLALLLLFIGVVWHRCRKGKRSYVVNAVTAIGKYRFLICQLVGRDFKTKYKRSVLGIFWSFLNPLLTMLATTPPGCWRVWRSPSLRW